MVKRNLLAAVLLSAVAMNSWSVTREDTHLNLSDSSRVYDIDEVIVVSQPKEVFRLRQQPVSSSSFAASEMSRLNIHDLRELSNYVPGFTMPNYGSRLTSSMYIRGIGSRVNSPAVGIYVDGIPVMSKSAFNFHTYQLERIDVLRGAQGTLYGQNAEGGLVRMYTRNPFNYQGTDINLSAGSHFYRNAEISHSQKLSDKVAFNIAGFYGGQKGFFRNIGTGERADKYNEAGGKFRLGWRPASRWNIDFMADYQYVNQNGFPYGELDIESNETNSPNTNRPSTYRRNMLNSGLNILFKANRFDFTSTTSYQYLRDNMLMDQDYLPQDYMHLRQQQLQNAFTQEFAFKSNKLVGGFWHWTAGAFFSAQWLKTKGPVFFDDAITNPIGNAIRSQMYNAMVQAFAGRMISQGIPAAMASTAAAAAIEKAGGVSLDVSMGAPGLYHTPQYNLAFYHESNFDITDRFTATLGLRYDYTHTKIHYESSAFMTMAANVMGQKAAYTLSTELDRRAHSDFNQLLPKFGLSYKIGNRGSNIYATVSKGYRAGGFNIQMFSDVLQTELMANSRNAMRGDYTVPHTEADYHNIDKTISYRPETSWNYEIGTRLNLTDNLQLDLSTYYMQVRNQQLSVMAGNYGYGRMMVNAGKSHSCGLEATLRGNLIDGHLDWAATYSYTRAKFDDYTDSVTTSTGKSAISYEDNYVPYTPQHTFAARADYRFDFTNSALKHITLGANVNGQGKIYWDEANSYSQKFYAVLGAHADVDFGWLAVSLWGRNLTDTRYNTFAIQSGATGETKTFAQRGNPFQIGVDMKIHF